MELDDKSLDLLDAIQNPLEGVNLENQVKQTNFYLNGVFYRSREEMDYGLLQVVYLVYQAVMHNYRSGQEHGVRFERSFLTMFLNLAYMRYFGYLDPSKGRDTMAKIEAIIPHEKSLDDMQHIY
jgi:hypothetical protein